MLDEALPNLMLIYLIYLYNKYRLAQFHGHFDWSTFKMNSTDGLDYCSATTDGEAGYNGIVHVKDAAAEDQVCAACPMHTAPSVIAGVLAADPTTTLCWG